MENYVIRNATLKDVEEIAAIYSYYVENTAISFECVSPTAEEYKVRFEKITADYPFLVAVRNKKVIAFAYAHAFSERQAYRKSAELTVYVLNGENRKGLGCALYSELETLLKEKGITNLYARVASPLEEDEYLTRNSEKFHSRMGFVKVGCLNKCGTKFGRWYNMLYMEKIIGTHD